MPKLGQPIKPLLSEAQVLRWARAYYRRHGRWPGSHSGPVHGAKNETWGGVVFAAFHGTRGMPKGTSLHRLLCEKAGKTKFQKEVLKPAQVARWARRHFKQFGKWPDSRSGRILDARGGTWSGIESALKAGVRGFSGGDTLARFLARHVKRRIGRQRPPLSDTLILRWARRHNRKYGVWPTCDSGAVIGIANENWGSIDRALKYGHRDLRPGRTLARLLREKWNVIRKGRHEHGTRLTLPQILAWADAHRKCTGNWPRPDSRRISSPPFITWETLNNALIYGKHGLPRGLTIQRLLRKERNAPFSVVSDEPVTVDEILAWADSHHRRTGRWPTFRSGSINERNSLSWALVHNALRQGRRQLPKAGGLAHLLAIHRGVRNRKLAPPLDNERILTWAREHHRRTGQWPSVRSGPVAMSPGETWSRIYSALSHGLRGLQPGGSLTRLLDTLRGASDNPHRKRRLDINNVVLWAKAHFRRTGHWPDLYSGRIPDARGESWFEIEEALKNGGRGLPKNSSIKKIVKGLAKPSRLVAARSRHKVR